MSGSSEPKLDFDVLFGREDLTPELLLATPDIIDEVRMNSDGFSGHLKERGDIVRELMDYAVQPQLQQQKKGEFPITFPFVAIELLCGQNEQFLDFILGIRREGKPSTAELKTNASIETAKEQKEKPKADLDCPLTHLFRFLEVEQRINETAAGYLLRFLSQVQYQRSAELFQFFEAHPAIVSNMLRHAYSKSLTDALSKLFCVEQEEVPPAATQFTEAKDRLLGRLFGSLAAESREKELGQRLENFVFMVEDLIERCQDRYDGVRFTALLSRAISLPNVELLNELLLKRSDNELVLLPGLDVLSVFLAFYKADRIKQNRKNNVAEGSDIKQQTTMVAEEADAPNAINNEVLLAVEKLASKLLEKFESKELSVTKQAQAVNGKDDHRIVEQTPFTNSPSKEQSQETPSTPEKPSPNKSESLLLEDSPTKPKFSKPPNNLEFSQLKLFLIVQELIALEPKNSNFEEELLTVPFVRYAIALIRQHPRNNLLHNTLKHILIKGIKGKGHTARAICSPSSGLIPFIMENANAECSFTNQLHHISAAIEELRKKDPQLQKQVLQSAPQWETYIKGSYSETLKAHNRLLGGEDPKKKSEICMMGFGNRLGGGTKTATKEEVEEVKHYSARQDRGEMGDDNEEEVVNLCLGIDSDEEKNARPKESGAKIKRGMALCALMTRDEVKSEDEDTVRMDEDLSPMPMEIQIIPHHTQHQHKQETAHDAPHQESLLSKPSVPEQTIPEHLPVSSTEQPSTEQPPTASEH